MDDQYSFSSPRLSLTYVPDVPAFDLAGPARCGVYYLFADGVSVGAVSLTGVAKPNAEIGYRIEPDFQGQGYASEAVAAVLADVSAHHGYSVLSATARASNSASRRVLEKAGFKRVSSKLCWNEDVGEPAAVDRYRIELASHNKDTQTT